MLRYEIRGSYFNFRAEAQTNAEAKTAVVLLDNNGGRYVGRIAAAIDSILTDKSFSIPMKSIYWAMRDSSGLDAEEIIAYYNHLKASDPTVYNFDDPDALYYVGRGVYRNNDSRGAQKILGMNLEEFPNHQESIELLQGVKKEIPENM